TAQWEEEVYTMKYFDSNGNEVTDFEGVDTSTLTIKYYNSRGNEVSESQANSHNLNAPTSASYANAYRKDYEFQKEFTSNYYYTRSYNYNYVGNPVYVLDGKTITDTPDCNYAPWTVGEHALNNLFDGDLESVIHFSSAWGVSENKPAILAFDIGEAVKANSMILYTNNTANGNSKGFPSNFTLEGSLDGVNYFEMGKWTGIKQPSISIELTFNDNKTYDFRYFRLTVTSSNNGRVSLAELRFANTLRLTGNGNNHFSLDSDMFTLTGKWTTKSTFSCFGHVFVGQKNSQATFSFEGTRLMILSSSSYGRNFEVYIDGKKVSSAPYDNVTTPYIISYLSPKLSNGKHTVKIKCTGQANIDSIVTYTEKD
ncbi:MAG: discoidin domain-containing protein, partial [Clostridia bacterium]|nr:discoidin domain-containing protein [Clostridia bacterium]